MERKTYTTYKSKSGKIIPCNDGFYHIFENFIPTNQKFRSVKALLFVLRQLQSRER